MTTILFALSTILLSLARPAPGEDHARLIISTVTHGAGAPIPDVPVTLY